MTCLIYEGRGELGPETNLDHLPWRIRTTSLENLTGPTKAGSVFPGS